MHLSMLKSSSDNYVLCDGKYVLKVSGPLAVHLLFLYNDPLISWYQQSRSGTPRVINLTLSLTNVAQNLLDANAKSLLKSLKLWCWYHGRPVHVLF